MADLTYLSLFSGIGGLDLGLDRAGWTCVGQVEKDPYCRTVLEEHWPDVPRHDDAQTAPSWWMDRGAPAVDLVAGGPPCQPFSVIGHQLGTGDPRWGWPWMADVIRAARPRFVLVENVPGLLADADAIGTILGDLSDLGFHAEWSTVSACSMGAPHVRERLFVVAYPNCGDGPARLGPGTERDLEAVESFDGRARAWRDSVDRSVEASRADGRDVDGSAIWMVEAGGNAVVPQVAEYVGRLIAGMTLTGASA